eukprot:Pgem_evm1s12989
MSSTPSTSPTTVTSSPSILTSTSSNPTSSTTSTISPTTPITSSSATTISTLPNQFDSITHVLSAIQQFRDDPLIKNLRNKSITAGSINSNTQCPTDNQQNTNSSITTTNNNDTTAQSISSILDSFLSSDINNPKPHTSQSSSPSTSHNNNLSLHNSALDNSLQNIALHENIREATIFISQVKHIYHNRSTTLYDTIRNQIN